MLCLVICFLCYRLLVVCLVVGCLEFSLLSIFLWLFGLVVTGLFVWFIGACCCWVWLFLL